MSTGDGQGEGAQPHQQFCSLLVEYNSTWTAQLWTGTLHAQEALIIQEGVRKPLFMVSAAQSAWKFCCPKASCGTAGRRAGRQGCCLNPGKISCKAGVALNSARLLASRDSCWSVAFGLFSDSSCEEHRAGPARDSEVAAIEACVPDLAAFHPLEDKYHCQGPF